MSMTRAIYDTCSYRQDMGSQVNALTWQLDPVKYEHCDNCRMAFGVVGGSTVSHVTGNIIDLENDLRGTNRINTKCAAFKHLPSGRPYVQGTNYIPGMGKNHPKVATNLRHLPSCQLYDVAAVPKTPHVELWPGCYPH